MERRTKHCIFIPLLLCVAYSQMLLASTRHYAPIVEVSNAQAIIPHHTREVHAKKSYRQKTRAIYRSKIKHPKQPKARKQPKPPVYVKQGNITKRYQPKGLHYHPIVAGEKQKKYHVKAGDTLYSIAWAYRMDFRTLALANHLHSPYALSPGQTLWVRSVEPRGVPSARAQKAKVLHIAKTKSSARHYASAQKPSPASQRRGYVGHKVLQWNWPAKGKVVATFSKQSGGNKGIDIAGAYGSPVWATAPGKVVYSGSGLKGYGKLIIIKHNNHYLSAYAYNKRFLVKEGDKVKARQKIAELGKTGRGKVQLHFEIRQNGEPINPLTYLKS